MSDTRLAATVHGHVQGVGFRWWVQSHAVPLGLTGSAQNMSDGTVQVVAEGTADAVNQLLGYLTSGSTPGAVSRVDHNTMPATGEFTRFSTL